jgi:hypothetical protein
MCNYGHGSACTTDKIFDCMLRKAELNKSTQVIGSAETGMGTGDGNEVGCGVSLRLRHSKDPDGPMSEKGQRMTNRTSWN